MADPVDTESGEPPTEAQHAPGDLVRHVRFDYRGVVVDVDAEFSLDDAWYERNAVTRPPKDRPWYHVLVDGSDAATYVAERNLEADESRSPIRHPLIDQFFTAFRDGRYVSNMPHA